MTEIDRLVASGICVLRENAGLSRAMLAAFARLSPESMELIETGRQRPTAAQLFAIADALDLPVERLFDPAGAIQPAPRSHDAILDKIGSDSTCKEVVAAYEGMTPTHRYAAFALIKARKLTEPKPA